MHVPSIEQSQPHLFCHFQLTPLHVQDLILNWHSGFIWSCTTLHWVIPQQFTQCLLSTTQTFSFWWKLVVRLGNILSLIWLWQYQTSKVHDSFDIASGILYLGQFNMQTLVTCSSKTTNVNLPSYLCHNEAKWMPYSKSLSQSRCLPTPEMAQGKNRSS